MNTGDRVKLVSDVLQRHSRSIPAYMGYTTAQFRWRDLLRSLEGKTGVVTRVFPNSTHVNVNFDGVMIGINHTELETV